jgi:predicted PurR-regulated permease PerM
MPTLAPGGILERQPRPTLAQVARFCGYLLLILATVAVGAWVLAKVTLLFLAIFVAVLLAALLAPVFRGLVRHRWPRSLAALLPVLATVLVLAGVLAWIVPRTVSELQSHGGELTQRVNQMVHKVAQALPAAAPQPEQLVQRASTAVRDNWKALAGGVLSGAAGLAALVTGMLLTLVLTFFFVRDGRRMVERSVGLLPRGPQAVIFPALCGAWKTLSAWIRGAVIVALVDAAGIGIGLFALRIPLALPLIVLTFLGAFIPVVGATVAGGAAVLVALATGGVTDALIILAIVLAVQQLEGNVLQPYVMGKYVPLHPAVILILVTGGALVGGITGAFIAVPLGAAVSAFLREVHARTEPVDRSRGTPGPGEPPPRPDRREEGEILQQH